VLNTGKGSHLFILKSLYINNYCFLLPLHKQFQTYCAEYQSWQREEDSGCRTFQPQWDLNQDLTPVLLTRDEGCWSQKDMDGYVFNRHCPATLVACIVYKILINQSLPWFSNYFVCF